MSDTVVNTCTPSLRDTLNTLRQHGINVAVSDDAISTAVAAGKLAQGGSLPATFANADAYVSKKDGKACKISAEEKESLRTLMLNEAQLRRAAAIVSGCDSELADADKTQVAALDKMIKAGASFKISYHTSEYREFWADKERDHGVVVPSDRGGLALMVLHTSNTNAAQMRYNQIAMVAKDKTYAINSLQELVSTAEHL